MTARWTVAGVGLALLAAAPASWAQQRPTEAHRLGHLTSESVRRIIDPLLRRQLETRKIAGAVVVVVKDGTVLWNQGYGYADVAARRIVDSETLVRIASVTKLLTAIAAMQLVEKGELDLDRDVNVYLDFRIPSRPGHAPVTLRRLLSHRTGFEDRIAGIGAWSGERRPLGPYLAQHVPPRLQQGDDVIAYSNFNAALTAYIVERVSDQVFERYLDEHVFAPLQMTRSTAAQPLPDNRAADVSNGYVRSDLPPTPLSMAASTIYEVGSTGVVTSGTDMGRLMRALLAQNPGILSRASLDVMMTGQAPVPMGAMGLGFYAPPGVGGNPFIGHDGNTGGFQSTLALLPQEGFGLFVSYNSSGAPLPVPAATELLQRTAERFFPDASLLPSSPGGHVEAAGTYEPTRRVESSLFRLRGLVDQLAVRPVGGGLTIGPAFLPVGEPLEPGGAGLFRWAGREVSFAGSGAATTMQIGAPGQFRRVVWWERAGVIVPTVLACVVTAAVAVAAWPITSLMRRRRFGNSRTVEPLESLNRLALLLNLAAIGASFWLVLWGWPLAAMSSPIVAPLTAAIYGAAWAAVLITPAAVWSVARSMHRGLGFWRIGREAVLAVVLLLLSLFCLHWHIAGTSLAL